MNIHTPVVAVSPLRQRPVDEMEIRRFGRETQRNYIRDVGRFATFLGRSPNTATAEAVRRFHFGAVRRSGDVEPGGIGKLRDTAASTTLIRSS